MWHRVKALVILVWVVFYFFFNCMQEEAGYKYLCRLLGNKLHVVFVKTMSSSRIYIGY